MDTDSSQSHFHKAQNNPDIDSISSLRLYEGTRVRQELIYGVVKDRKTGKFHHDYATFKTYRKSKTQPWKPDPKASFTLSEDKAQALTQALAFLGSHRPGAAPIAAVSNESGDSLGHQELLQAISHLDAEDRLEILLRLIRDLLADAEPRQIMGLFEQIDSVQLSSAERLFQIASWRKAMRELHRLLRDPVSVPEQFCRHISEHPWLIGHDASEPLSLPDVPDGLLFRCPDNWLELVLIRTPLTEHGLFHGDDQHGWHPIHELSQTLGRAQLLLERLEPEALLSQHAWSLQGRRARILIGHSRQDPHQERALQRYNRHLQQLEVQTFDQIDRLAKGALSQLQVRFSPFKS